VGDFFGLDAMGRESTVACTDADGTNSLGHHAFPTLTTSPIPDSSGQHGSSSPLSTSRTYDYWTGLVISSIDLRGQTTTVEYNDPLSRPTRMVPPTGGGEIVFEYVDDPENLVSPGNTYRKIKTKIDTNTWDEALTYFDGLGRKIKTESRDASGPIFSETVYDSLGRVTKSSTPYRTGEEKLWVETIYDVLGRTKEVISPKIAGEPVAAKITSEYSTSSAGMVTVGINQAGNKTRSVTNALGQLVRFDENNASNDLGTVDNPVQPTYYKYDVVGNLRRVTQGDQDPDAPGFNPAVVHQSRFFLYDSIGKIIRVWQPEQEINTDLNLADPLTGNSQWSTGFTYLASGSIQTVTDPKGAVTTFSYDNLGRPFQKSYTLPQTSDPKKITFITPTVTMKYDGLLSATPDNPSPALVQLAKGSLTEISNGLSTTQHTSFDGVGRVLSSKQVTDGQVYNFSYEYNLEGTLKSQTYPSGRVVTHTFDTAGDVSSIASGAKLYASNFHYTNTGAIDQLQFGNLKWQTSKINARHQITEIGLGTSPTDTSLWKVKYDYGRFKPDGSIDVAKNDGNVIQQTITVPGVATPFVQTYKYDPVNRLSEALETSASNENWKQVYGYDRFGNRNSFTYNINQTPVTLTSTNNPAIDPWTSRINSAGYLYDLNGNIITDSQGRKFSFDADNKQREIKDSANNVIATYEYDGGGRRVKKTSGGNQTVFVYNATGQLIAEYSNQPSTSSGTTYITADILNSPRVLTNQNGNVISRRDHMPFGETIAVSRNATEKYGVNDGLRKSFTGYERDSESSLDFAEARYYNSAHGRFTAVDPLLMSGVASNPQTFNRYVYAGNNPTRRTDPNGEAWYVETKMIDGIKTITYEWDSRNLTLIKDVARVHIVYMNYGPVQGLVALDPWENRYKVVASVAEAREQIEVYRREAALNFIAGAAEAHSLILELSGALEGFGVNTNSEQYKLGKNVGTITSLLLAAGGGPSLVNLLLKRSGTGVKFLARELNLVAKGKTVIGHNPAYVRLAEQLGANHLNVPEKIWEALSNTERWDMLKGFLDEAIARGDDFLLATPLNEIKEGSWFAKEIKYLLDTGKYVLNEAGTALIFKR
jgi:RHS repeat-associated protein